LALAADAGIYRLDPHRAAVLRPSVSRWMYWNGHWWWHETNEDGYRGPRLARADVVLLGDSMIYGHGVNQADTVAARLAARTGLATANLGQQGTGQIQSLLTLRAHGRRLAPKTVFACFHFSDGDDSLTYYPPSELARFVGSSGEDAIAPQVRDEYAPPPFWNPRHLFAVHLALPLRCSGILGTVARSLRGRGPALSSAPRRDPLVPTPEEISAPFLPLHATAPEDLRVCWRAQEQAALEMRRFCDSIGARLVLFDIGYPQEFTGAVEALAHRLGAEYNPAGRVALQRCLAGEVVYLANDGHWTGVGAQIVADELARTPNP
jgi:hypothetical protein